MTVKNNTVIVNLFAGPSAGKTTCAWEIAAELKKRNIVTEYVSEYAKELVWDDNFELLDGTHQQQLFDEQNRRLERIYGKVEVIVTDSPLLLNLLYLKQPNEEYLNYVFNIFNRYNNFNLFINRGSTFEQEGRIHNLKQSIEIDNQIKELLNSKQIYYGTYYHQTVNVVVENIMKTLNRYQGIQDEKPFELPPKADNSKRLFAYLCGSRGLDKEIVQELLNRGKLYESTTDYSKDGEKKTLNNAVFVGFDKEGVARSGFQRGLIANVEHPFKRDVYGSEKEFAFCINGEPNVETVAVFKASIDAISHATIEKLSGQAYKSMDRIALGGVAFKPLQRYLENHPYVKNVILCVDSDQAGDQAAEDLKNEMYSAGFTPENGYHCVRQIPTGHKDFNEYLISYKKAIENEQAPRVKRIEQSGGQEEDGFFPEAECEREPGT